MKIDELRKLRSWCQKKRHLHTCSYEREQYSPMNLHRPRIAGRMEAFDAVLDRLDSLLKRHRTTWEEKKKRKN